MQNRTGKTKSDPTALLLLQSRNYVLSDSYSHRKHIAELSTNNAFVYLSKLLLPVAGTGGRNSGNRVSMIYYVRQTRVPASPYKMGIGILASIQTLHSKNGQR